MTKSKTAKTRRAAAKPRAADPSEARAGRTAERIMQTVLQERDQETVVQRLDQWVPIECPHCGEGTEIHVIADMDGQSVDQDCSVCCRPFIAQIDIEDDEANVSVEAA
ncbi:MAG: CPXCG motif-containing cysteine-rich protein [Elusimicrobia bacterium]|nr:CPXCG motif-containing cysteine-rich protein [Elusimicrobiota bacterium]